MIKSITFDLHGDFNYITDPKYKRVFRKGKGQKGYEKALAEFEQQEKDKFSWCRPHRWWSKQDIEEAFFEDVEDGYANEYLVNNLKDRMIEFSQDKVNLIFGPNASGKTTILKAIAAHAMCGTSMQFDGFSNPLLFDPIDLMPKLGQRDEPYAETSHKVYELVDQEAFDNITESLKNKIDKKAGNGVTIDWDGSLVYYENFAGRKSYGDIATDFTGSIMGGLSEAMSFHVYSNSISMGQKTMHLLSKIVSTIEAGWNVQKVIDSVEQKMTRCNSTWYNAWRVQLEYFKSKYNVPDNGQEVITFMFDEIDKSLDILNVIALYRDIIPEIRKKYPVQIIMISHNPIVLSSLLKPEDYNIISIDEKYTSDIKSMLSGISY